MEFEKSLLIGMVKPFSIVDQMFQSQGFSRRGRQSPTYDIRIEDTASHTVYYLRIPARQMGNKENTDALLKLDRPYIRKRQGPNRYNPTQEIPDSVVEAAQHKMAEIASYLKTTTHS